MKSELFIFTLVSTVFIGKGGAQETEDPSLTSEGPTSTLFPPVTPVLYLDEDNRTWTPTFNQKVLVACDLGYKIVVTILECEIDGNNGEYAIISNDKIEKSLIFTYNVSNTPSYLFFTDQLNATFVGTEASTFSVLFSRVGEQLTTTTTELISSTPYVPVPSSNDSYELVVHLTGKSPYDYENNETLDSLKYMILQMAQHYCEEQNFGLVSNITMANIKIEIQICRPVYPNCNPCAEVRLAIPVDIDESNSMWTGYQLDGNHLKVMWDHYAEQYLGDGIASCQQSSADSWVKWQIVLIAVCTAVFFLLFLIMRYYIDALARKAGRQRRKMSDGPQTFAFESRLSQISLPPHYLQETPALFDNTYPMYKPGLGSSNIGYESFGDEIKESQLSLEDSDVEESGA